MNGARRSVFAALADRRIAQCVLLGFASGLPLYLLLNLVPAWLRTEGISLKAIGAITLVQFPYTWKFVWAPLIDRFALASLGRRRTWMAITQLGLLAVIGAMGFASPRADLSWVVAACVACALLSATQDIAIDAYRRELLPDASLGLGNSVHVNAYRIAGLVPGSLSLVLADHLPWSAVFAITALFVLPGLALTLIAAEPAVAPGSPRTLRAAVVEPFREFVQRAGLRHALLVLAFLFLYKLGDSMATALATPFYLDMGYTRSDIGLIAKNAGLWPSVIGGLAGGLAMVRIGIARALWLFGVVQAVTILGFAWLASIGPFVQVGGTERAALALVIGGEALGVGLGTAAFVAFIARETHPAYTATQFALFTGLAAAPRTVVNAVTGVLVEAVGWNAFFWLCFGLALPGMVLLGWVAPWGEDGAGDRAMSRIAR